MCDICTVLYCTVLYCTDGICVTFARNEDENTSKINLEKFAVMSKVMSHTVVERR